MSISIVGAGLGGLAVMVGRGNAPALPRPG
jgi:hypothetical protein